jgi:hypothetical protein
MGQQSQHRLGHIILQLSKPSVDSRTGDLRHYAQNRTIPPKLRVDHVTSPGRKRNAWPVARILIGLKPVLIDPGGKCKTGPTRDGKGASPDIQSELKISSITT